MTGDGSGHWITPTRGAKTLPSVEILTGRGFITGKSGSGKSTTASVIAEELLEHNFNLLVIDPEGEYYGLKERYKMLHVGADDHCDVQVGPQHAEKIAEIALTRNMPVILDVSDFLDGEEAKQLISNVVEELYRLEKDVRKPFLLMVEEMQEYMPQSGGSDDLATLLERVAKRGRKRGLGMLGMSQRPSSVDKDFITQCDWMVWHKLTWKNDLDVVKNIIGKERAEQVKDFDPGEGFLMTDWDDVVERVQFKQKRTHDAGATPGLESYERPDLKSVGSELLEEFGDRDGSFDESWSEPETDEESSEPVNDDRTDAELHGLNTITDGDSSQELEVASTPDNAFEGVEERDFEGMDEEELREVARSLERRNQVLSDEVSELRSILKAVESAETSAGHPQSPAIPDDGPSQTQNPASTQVSPPRAPRPPVERSGVAGNLIEFSEMTLYMVRMLFYRMRLLVRDSS